MGDKIVIEKIVFLDYTGSKWGDRQLYQIDFYNEEKDERYRTFIDCNNLEKMLQEAKVNK